MNDKQKVLSIMLTDTKRWWHPTDFMKNNENFVGYSASARMSELKKLLPGLFVESYDKKFRTLKINNTYLEENKKEIEIFLK